MRWLAVVLLGSLATAGLIALWLARSAFSHTPSVLIDAVPSDRPQVGSVLDTHSYPLTPQQAMAIDMVDVTDETGIDLLSFSGTTPEKYFPTANGTGVAMLDYNQDGLLDLYFANACELNNPDASPPNELWRARADGKFERISSPAGADFRGFTQGLSASDFDNDGFPDLYLIRYGANVLLGNNGDGTFRDSSLESGTNDPRWGTSAAFLDYDEDGALDLYVANYGQWDMAWHQNHYCGDLQLAVRIYCRPKILQPQVHRLYRSRGDGTFVDVATELGIARTDGRGQGVVACDVNNDGHIDIYVANDQSPNFLFINRGGGRMEDRTDVSGAAYDAHGETLSGMGVDAADVDGDGLPDLFVTNFILEHNSLYRNLGNDLYQDVSFWSGVADGSMNTVGWGTALEDLDSDGWLDIFVANGHVDDNLHKLGKNEPYAQPASLWRNLGKGQFQSITAAPFLQTNHVSRGVAFGDLDNDGAVDIVITHKDERPTILHNESRSRAATANAWIQITAVGTRSNRDAIGTRVELLLQDGRRITRHIRGGKSYLSAHDLRLTVGLGGADRVDRMTLYWPSGQSSVMERLDVNRSYLIREPK
jgi:enediyne biosynthesis protein E4